MSRDDGYARAFHWFRREAVPALGLTPPQIAVYDVLVDRADEEGICWPSQDLIAAESGQGVRAVRAALKVLASVGLVEVQPGTRQGNRYRVGMRPRLPIPASRAAIAESAAANPRAIASSGADHSGISCRSIAAPGADEGEPGKDNQEGQPRNSAERAAVRPMTDAQRRNITDALETIGEQCDSIDVLVHLPAELTYMETLHADTRRKRISAWAGLRSRAEQPGGDDLVEDDRLHALLAAHGYVWRADDTGPWATYREETAV